MKIITQNHIAEFLALLTSLIFFGSLKKGKLKSLPFFLLFILLVELTGSYLRRVAHTGNTWLYNLSIPVEYSYYLYLFWLHGRKGVKRFVSGGIVLFWVVVIFCFFSQRINVLHDYVLVTGEILVIITSCSYIYELFQSNEETSLFRNYFYWLVAGLLLFNLGDVIYFVLYPVIHEKKWDRFDLIFKLINNSLLLLLYLSYIISILVLRQNQRE
jgi:hypothetical protein